MDNGIPLACSSQLVFNEQQLSLVAVERQRQTYCFNLIFVPTSSSASSASSASSQ
jgi:hypothetical protein